MKRLMRFRVLHKSLVLEGIHLPRGDYDGEISWSDVPFRGRQNRVPGPSRIEVTRAVLDATGQSNRRDVPINLDATMAIKRGDVVVL